MADSSTLVAIISGLVSGGSSAATTFMAAFQSIRKRLKDLEDSLGSNEDPKTGLHLVVERLDETVRKVKREIDSWQDEPPDWMIRLVNRAARGGSINTEFHRELEQRVESMYRANTASLRRVQEDLDALRKTLDNYIERAEYEKDARARSDELSKVREQLATSNGLLRGVMSALGYIDPEKRQRGK